MGAIVGRADQRFARWRSLHFFYIDQKTDRRRRFPILGTGPAGRRSARGAPGSGSAFLDINVSAGKWTDAITTAVRIIQDHAHQFRGPRSPVFVFRRSTRAAGDRREYRHRVPRPRNGITIDALTEEDFVWLAKIAGQGPGRMDLATPLRMRLLTDFHAGAIHRGHVRSRRRGNAIAVETRLSFDDELRIAQQTWTQRSLRPRLRSARTNRRTISRKNRRKSERVSRGAAARACSNSRPLQRSPSPETEPRQTRRAGRSSSTRARAAWRANQPKSFSWPDSVRSRKKFPVQQAKPPKSKSCARESTTSTDEVKYDLAIADLEKKRSPPAPPETRARNIWTLGWTYFRAGPVMTTPLKHLRPLCQAIPGRRLSFELALLGGEDSRAPRQCSGGANARAARARSRVSVQLLQLSGSGDHRRADAGAETRSLTATSSPTSTPNSPPRTKPRPRLGSRELALAGPLSRGHPRDEVDRRRLPHKTSACSSCSPISTCREANRSPRTTCCSASSGSSSATAGPAVAPSFSGRFSFR